MKTFQTTLLIAILWLMTANSTTYAYDPADFLPLAVGNSWTYLHTYALVAEYLSPEEIGDI
ncbi:MAG: hypothetical protein KAJ05_10720, partial [Candidatus Latescibacteria bacterium]|nr:hypothetical protein [Candidatus Latescibacterota bacterium]